MKCVRPILALLLLAGTVFAQNGGKEQPQSLTTNSSRIFQLGSPKDVAYMFTVNRKGGELLVGISPDGKITYGEGYKPDVAARQFWQSMADEYPHVCDARQKQKP